MGLKDKMIKKAAEIEERRPQFTPLELNEGNVQAIFNRCLRKEDSKEITRTTLFSRVLGYAPEDEIEIAFDKNVLLENEKNIRYLYGQLKVVHTAESKTNCLSLNDFKTAYQGIIWAQSKSSLLELLYLGCNSALGLGYRFSKKYNDTTIISSDITPTLSPKDPAFPAWWETHKSEWEA